MNNLSRASPIESSLEITGTAAASRRRMCATAWAVARERRCLVAEL